MGSGVGGGDIGQFLPVSMADTTDLGLARLLKHVGKYKTDNNYRTEQKKKELFDYF